MTGENRVVVRDRSLNLLSSRNKRPPRGTAEPGGSGLGKTNQQQIYTIRTNCLGFLLLDLLGNRRPGLSS